MSPTPPQRLLAGATILQLVPALRDDSVGRTAVDIARALLQSGARAMVAGKDGPLVDELAAIGGEFLPMATDTFNPLRIHANARRLVNLIGSERIDIVHAQSVGAARSALAATRQMPGVSRGFGPAYNRAKMTFPFRSKTSNSRESPGPQG